MRFRGRLCGLVLTALVSLAVTAGAEEKSKHKKPAASGDLDALRAASQAFVEAFNAGNAEAVAACWTKDGDYVDETGAHFTGREAIAKEYAAFFAANSGAKIRLAIDSLRLVGDAAAIEDGRAFLESDAGAPGLSKYVAVHSKVDGRWLMSAVRDSRVETPSNYGRLADLEWLVGTWSAEENGAKNEVVCQWVPGKSFLQRRYKLTLRDGTETSGVQFIGWNAQAQRIQSWTFSSDGGHAVGLWSPRESGWEIETHGQTGAGANTTATNILTRLDENGLAWESIGRSVGGEAVPDTGEIVLRRQTASR